MIEAHARREVGAGADEFQLATDRSSTRPSIPCGRLKPRALFELPRAGGFGVTCSREGRRLVEGSGANPGRLLMLDGRRGRKRPIVPVRRTESAARPPRHACLL